LKEQGLLVFLIDKCVETRMMLIFSQKTWQQLSLRNICLSMWEEMNTWNLKLMGRKGVRGLLYCIRLDLFTVGYPCLSNFSLRVFYTQSTVKDIIFGDWQSNVVCTEDAGENLFWI
jgi:hypothetical protein